ncbi:TrkH family potassium uptake protein [Halococcus thailandensis]|uniref:Trk-type k+ transporter, membrane component n=1 Tax=Halococcus thailandensis JCM 13552 TaxID=1227457 RepID=M0NGA5_9EURY|nr:TrkH family potassium uptake protein [Halococcus thailandensis]EMA56129.1 trk-type k+ transporter, membrane component [Halococcus thailandensis JCM 13552]
MRHGSTVAGIPADLATIARDIGSLLLIESALMGASALVGLAFGEYGVALAFFLAATATLAVGGIARRTFATAPAPQTKHGMVIAAAGWLLTAVFGALPFFLSAHLLSPATAASYIPEGASYAGSSLQYFTNPLHAVFESMSGWTGSGLTMAVHEPSLPRTLLWWRSLMQWVGGVGVIVLTVSILSRPGSGSYTLYRSEAREERIHPSIVSTVRTVWKIFVGYTILAIIVLFGALLVSEPLAPAEAAWQALNHAMTSLATGGFSVTDNSIATYDSPLVETVLLPIMTLGAIAFPIHYAILKNRDFRALLADLQTRWLFVLLGVGIVVLTLQNFQTFAPLLSLRDSAFQFVSALSCTGFQSSPIGQWSAGGKLIMSSAMVLGGAAGSTVGGIKIIRGYTIVRGIRWQFSRVFLPVSAVVTTHIGDRKLDREEMEQEFSEAAIVSLLWVLILIGGSIILSNLVGPGFSYADTLFEVASAQGNVGLSTGITGPSMNPIAEGMLVINMWIGRLEIIPILVFLRSLIYGLNP